MRGLILKPHLLSLAGLVGEAVEARGGTLVDHVLSEDGTPPSPAEFDVVLVMGSPWSVYGDEVAPWIEGALGAIREAVDREVPVLGVCFGAQAFAEALGGRARPADEHEIGWHTVRTHDPELIPAGPWFMWHGDTFDLPPGASAVASTQVGVQAYTMGRHLCVQFHPEVTADLVAEWMSHDDSDFRQAGLDPVEVLEETQRREPEARNRAAALVDRFLARVR
jgi:GMP synthase-like glutamine amidotransferase